MSGILIGTALAFILVGSTLMFAKKRHDGMKLITELIVYIMLAAVASAMAVEVLHAFGVYYR